MNTQSLEAKRHFINGKTIIGIDPAKKKHQAVVIDSIGLPVGSTFKFNNSFIGFHHELFTKLKSYISDLSPDKVVFAVEVSINLWQKLCYFLCDKGFTVLMVSPLFTHHERPKINNNFSRTDPKDALAVANCARQGYFNFYRQYPSSQNAMHRLSITYDKLKKHLVQTKQRIRSQVELIFPEFLNALDVDTDTARYILSKYLTPNEFLSMNVFLEAKEVMKVSQRQHGEATLKALKEAAKQSIGITISDEEIISERITLNCWLGQYILIKEQINYVLEQLIALAEQTPYFDIITSLKGISDITAARFIAELRDLSYFDHYKKIEAISGLNLKLSQSGQFTGYRRITHIGNHRLRAIIYSMAEETKNHIPEIRIRYLKRQMKQPRYRKNVIASSSNLLKLIAALVKGNHKYQYKEDKQRELIELEKKYKEFKEKKKKKYKESA
jgi:transposase